MTHLSTLIERWQAGDEKAAEAIYNLHQAKTYRLAYGLVGNREDAEEAAQDALTYALLNIHHYDERRSQFTTWLHMITVSRCRDILRKRRLPAASFSEWLRSLAERKSKEPSPEGQTIAVEEKNTIWEAVQELSPPLQEVIVLRHWGAHTYQEIAEIVGCPIRTAQSRVRLAYGQLEKQLKMIHSELIAGELSE
jgi:RNA polymerase sigma-70 factor (ECF subfamily)